VTDRLTLSIFYQNAYAYVHPAPSDNLSSALLEAMSCGKAVVAADGPGVKNVVRDGENGLLVPARRSDEMARAMLRLVESAELANSLGQAARRSVETQFSWETIGERYLAEYQALLGRGA
jgi:glycosyltransferase involved in cell wall biosynthesis